MPKLVELVAFDVPEYTTPERSASKIVPCPYCRGFHVVPRYVQFVRLTCEASRPEFADLIDGGNAPRQLVQAFISGEPLSDNSDLWRLQPSELWSEVRHITHDLASYLKAVELR